MSYASELSNLWLISHPAQAEHDAEGYFDREDDWIKTEGTKMGILAGLAMGGQRLWTEAYEAADTILDTAGDIAIALGGQWVGETLQGALGVRPPLGDAHMTGTYQGLPIPPIAPGGGYGGALEEQQMSFLPYQPGLPTATAPVGTQPMPPGDLGTYDGGVVKPTVRALQQRIKYTTGRHMTHKQMVHAIKCMGPAMFQQQTGLSTNQIFWILLKPVSRRGRGITACDLRRTRSTLGKVKRIRADLRRFCAGR